MREFEERVILNHFYTTPHYNIVATITRLHWTTEEQ